MKPVIPDAALAQHLAVIAMTGSGKSYTVRGLVENLLDQGRRVCIIDYTGVWYGLRSAANGKRAAYPVVIFGGEHADVPLNEHAGPPLAKLVATGNRPCIIDVDGLTVGAQQRFVTAFLEELYRLNSKPLHLVIEETDEFAPQTGAPGAERMIGAVCRIFQRGRRKGFRAMAITQRPANLHKRVLTQCKTLVALQLNAPQDRAAVLDWIRGHADLDAGKAIVDDLPRLQVGQGYVWAPQQHILEKVTFPTIKTFDSMRAPEDGEQNEPASWAEVDLEDVKAAMADAVTESEANDPQKLRARIAELERQLRAGAARAEDPTQRAADLANAQALGYNQGRDEANAAWLRRAQMIRGSLQAIPALLDSALDLPERMPIAARAPVQRHETPAPAVASAAPSRLTHAARAGNGGMPKAERLILTALAQYPNGRRKAQVAILTGYAVNGGAFNNSLGALRSRAWITRGEPMQITEAGLRELGAYDPLPSGRALLEHWLGNLGKAERLILKAAADAYPGALNKQQVAVAAGYEANGGAFNNALGRLRTLELIRGRGEVRASEELFS